MAADESTISWGPSPTFGELVSGGARVAGRRTQAGLSAAVPPEDGRLKGCDAPPSLGHIGSRRGFCAHHVMVTVLHSHIVNENRAVSDPISLWSCSAVEVCR